MRALRGNRIAMIFQDPMMTLNPVLRIDTQMIETVQAHERVGREEARQRRADALGQVGIPSPDERLRSYPHQFSGGMRQRVAIAIALLHKPDVIVADEPTTALDVTIQGQILAEAQKLCRVTGTAMIWITHDLSVVAGLADDIAVMYAGRVVEQGPVDEVLDAPFHPYTVGLIGSVPSRNRRGEPLRQIPGMTPSLLDLPAGCTFRARCPRAEPRCAEPPPMAEYRPAASRAASTPTTRTRRRHERVGGAGGAGRGAGAARARHGAARRVPPLLPRASTSRRRSRRRLGAPVKEEVVHAVDGVDLSIAKGEVVGLVGESGCGKSTLGRMVAGILPPSDGAILWRGRDLRSLNGARRARRSCARR
jgi:oligopeptide/dipeptide ABC transporter ATP-binding protein